MTADRFRALCADNEFDADIIDEGMRLFRAGRVLKFKSEHSRGELTVEATVQGDRARPYSVDGEIHFTQRRTEFDGECSCDDWNCEHLVAALAAALLEVAEVRAVVGRIGPADAPEPAAPRLSAGLANWTQVLGAPLAPVSKAPPRQALCYVLNFDGPKSTTRLALRLMVADRTADGTLGRARSWTGYGGMAHLAGDPAVAADAPLLRTLLGEYGTLNQMNLTAEFAGHILPALLATERCFWGQPSRWPLRLGAARTASPGWQRLADHSQKATLLVEPAVSALLPTAPPWYLDKASHECGPLALSVAPDVGRRWLQGPTVMPEDSALLADSLQPLALPAPERFSVEDRRGVQPTPVLRLERFTFKKPLAYGRSYSWPPTKVPHVDIVRVLFDYEGNRVSHEDRSAFVTRLDGNSLMRIHRDSRKERELVDEALDTGLEPVQEYFSTMLPTETRDAFSLPDREAWLDWMATMLPRAERLGWKVEIGEGFPFRPVAVDDWYTSTESSGIDWFSYELGIMVEGQPLNLLPFLPRILGSLSAADKGEHRPEIINFMLPDGRMVRLPAERLRAIGATLAELFDSESLVSDRLRLSRLRAAELINLHDDVKWRGPEDLKALSQKLACFEGIRAVDPPPALQAILRPYQLLGLSWLQFLREHHFGGILADDMGLGKTLQALAHLSLEKHEGRAVKPSLVVAPTSLMANWRAEAERFATNLRTLVLHGLDRKEHFDKIPESDLVITSYPLLPRDAEQLRKQEFHLLILDEAQYIKNPRAKWSETARELRAAHRVAMTGTPMENNLGELWSIMHFLSPGYLGSEKQFRRAYRDPIEKHADAPRRTALARRLRPFILRRRKEDVLKDLPPKTEILRTVDLDGAQRDLYESVRLSMHQRVKDEVAKKGLSRSHIVILDALLKLRQICCDPRLLKLDAAKKVAQSAKRELLRELLPSMIAEGRRILLFSQFTSMLDLLEPDLANLGISFVRLDGSTTDRETPVRRFQSREVPLFLISLKAGGTGLNLTAADTVIHYDPWWNPAVERQATDRAHRIGQTNRVFVYKLLTAGTVEEKILELQKRKAQLVADLLSESPPEALQLSREDLNHLFDPLA